jgi:hypothetical protein
MALIGTNVTAPAARSSFNLGARQVDHVGKEFIYVQANGAITGAGYVCSVDETYQAVMVSTSNDAGGNIVGVAGAAFADDDYGWLQIKGPCLVQVAASCAANVRLNTTATGGQIDDDGTATTFSIVGLVLTAARAASPGTATAMANYPSVSQAAI